MNSRVMTLTDRSLVAATRTIRSHLGELYRCVDFKQIVLCPGQLVGIIHILHASRLRSILITDEEYYTARHFAGMEVFICKPEEVSKIALEKRPDVVLMSFVSWKGKLLPVEREFRLIRACRGDHPLLICDYAHAGAVGFPQFRSLTADLVCGDVQKWVLPSEHMAQIAFMWTPNRNLQEAMNRTFSGYYLAARNRLERTARWISPHDLLSTALWLRSSNSTRNELRRIYRQNLSLATQIAGHLGLEPPVTSCMLWLTNVEAARRKRELRDLESRTDVHVWRTSSGWRIMCSRPCLISEENRKSNG